MMGMQIEMKNNVAVFSDINGDKAQLLKVEFLGDMAKLPLEMKSGLLTGVAKAFKEEIIDKACNCPRCQARREKKTI